MDTAMDQGPPTLTSIHNNQLESNSNQSSTTSPNLTEKHKLIQRQLLLLIHADKCRSPNNFDNNKENTTKSTCTIQHCATMKQVLAHLATTFHSPEELKKCVGIKKCTFPYCYSSRLILTHWKHCIMKSHSIAKAAAASPTPINKNNKHCSICEPANKYLLLRHYGAQQKQDKKDRSLKRSTSNATLPQDDSQKKGSKKFKQAIGECTKQIWSGNLIWHKQFQISFSIINDQDILSCSIFAPNKKYNIEASNLNMKLIPSSVLTKLGLSNMGIQPVIFSFQENEIEELKNLLKSNHYSGFIYSTSNSSSSSTSGSNAIRFLILQSYDQVLNKFIGWIPIQQKSFIQKLKMIVSEAKAKCFNLEVVKKLNQLNCNDDSNAKNCSSEEDEMIRP